MENISTVTDQYGIEHIIIDHGNEEYTSMPKSVYDAKQAEQSTPNLAD